MPRRRSPEKRKILPDPKYKDIIVAKFMNHIMKDGKKSVAEKIVYGAFNKIDETAKTDPVELFKKALDTIGPMVEVKSRRVGGATYQVPIEVRPLEDRRLQCVGWLKLQEKEAKSLWIIDWLANWRMLQKERDLL